MTAQVRERVVRGLAGLRLAALALVLLFLAACGSRRQVAATGHPAPGTEPLDTFMSGFIAEWDGVGGALAVAKDGRLVFARGYGLADIEAGQAVQPDSLFRIGSVSKPLTAVAILKLVEQGRLDLDAHAFDILARLRPPAGQSMDPRIQQITVRHLLTHTAGWDREVSGDPILGAFGYTIASTLGVPAPPSAEDAIRYMLGQPLDFDPGSRYAYSNLGYMVLGRIIEQVSGRAYEDSVRQAVLRPMGLTRMRQGHTRLSERAPGEVRYYDLPGSALVRSVFPSDTGLVPVSYGGIDIEAIDSCGGWLASPVDLVHFASSVDGLRPPSLLTPRSVEQMLARPPYSFWAGSPWWYSLAWVIEQDEHGLTWSKNGSVWSDFTLLCRRPDGICWAVSFNWCGRGSFDAFASAVPSGVEAAVDQVRTWPDTDMSSEFFPESRPAVQGERRQSEVYR